MAITADSYMDTSELDTILSNHVYTKTKWSAFTDAEKDDYINSAMYQIDSQQWIGTKTGGDSQILEFPRDFSAEINSGLYYGVCLEKLIAGSNEIFRDLQIAELEIILQLVAFDTSDYETIKRANIEEMNIGRTAIKFKFWDKERFVLMSQQAGELMQCYFLYGNQPKLYDRM